RKRRAVSLRIISTRQIGPFLPQRTGRMPIPLISTQWKSNSEFAMHESLPNTIYYVEVPSRNLPATKKFFSALFGWLFVDYGPDYASFDDGRMAGGFFASEKTADVDSGAPLVVFYHPELEKT